MNRTHRLKALGNGIVPAVAYVFAGAIYDVLRAEASVQEVKDGLGDRRCA